VHPLVLSVKPGGRRPRAVAGGVGVSAAVLVAVSGSLAGGVVGVVVGTLGYVGLLTAMIVLVIQPVRNHSATEWSEQVPAVQIDRDGLWVLMGGNAGHEVCLSWSEVAGCRIRPSREGAAMLCFDADPERLLDGRGEVVRRVVEESVARYGAPIAINLEAAKCTSTHAVLSLSHAIRACSGGRVHLRPPEQANLS
jgi:hypothetical protein